MQSKDIAVYHQMCQTTTTLQSNYASTILFKLKSSILKKTNTVNNNNDNNNTNSNNDFIRITSMCWLFAH